MKSTTPCIAILLIVFFMTILIAGCISTPEQTPTLLPTITATNNSQQNDDFTIHISKDGRYSTKSTGTITKNFSEIIANNYTDIPNLIEPDDYTCGYTPTTNYSKISDIALHNPHIQKILRNGGVIQGIYIWKPEHHTKEMNTDPCRFCHITLELEYTYQKQQHKTAWINETTHEVTLVGGVE
jgi:hypothetical protein